MRVVGAAAILFVPLVAGCLSLGTKTIVQDRFNYNTAIRDSWEEQMLMNVVGLRYGEAPVFLDVDSVIAQYSLQTQAGLAGGINASIAGQDTLSVDGRATWAERPTITYSPLQGQEFTTNLLTPIEPSIIFAMIEAGWDAERSLRIIAKSINGLSAWDAEVNRLNREFFEVLRAFRVLQQAEALGIRRETDGEEVSTYVFLREGERAPEVAGAIALIADRLRLDPAPDEFRITYGLVSEQRDQIAMQTHSVLDILVEAAAFVLVPEVHVAEGRTRPNRTFDPEDEDLRPSLQVRVASDKPEHAAVAIPSRDYWFFIDDRDIESKNALSFLMIVLQLAAAEQRDKGPVVTIDAGS